MPYTDPQLQRDFQRDWMARRRDQWIREHGPCAECSSNTRLEVDHIDPTKKLDHRVWSWSQQRRDAELAKCQVLCHDCHRDKSIAQFPITAPSCVPRHPSHWQYKLGCRCEPCTSLIRDYHRRYRAKKHAK